MRRLPLALLVSMALSASAAAANGSPDPRGPDPRATELTRRFESPFCPGRSLDECTSPAAAGWRNDIRVWVDEGVSSAEIERRLEARAGRDLDMVPDAGVSIAMVALVSFLGLGAAVLVRRRLLHRKPSPPPVVAPADHAYERALDDELAMLD